MDYPLVTRARLKVIDRDTDETGDGSDNRPTETECEWLEIMRGVDSERDVLRKRISVCAIADVTSMSADHVTIRYNGEEITIRKPANGLKVAKAREVSLTLALEELNDQRQIMKGMVPIDKKFYGVPVEVIRILGEVADNFFFTPYL